MLEYLKRLWKKFQLYWFMEDARTGKVEIHEFNGLPPVGDVKMVITPNSGVCIFRSKAVMAGTFEIIAIYFMGEKFHSQEGDSSWVIEFPKGSQMYWVPKNIADLAISLSKDPLFKETPS